MQDREEWFEYFEDTYKTDYLYIYNIGYYDYRRRLPSPTTERVYNRTSLHFIVAGKGYFERDGKTYHLGAGDIFSVPAYEGVRFYPDEEDPWRYYWFSLIGTGAREIVESIGIHKQNPFFHYDKMDLVEARLDELLDSEFNHGEFYFRALSTMFYLISLFVKEKERENTVATSLVGAAKKIILENFNNENFSVSTIHEELYVSDTYLRKIFKRETGMTMHAFLVNRRLSKAADMLRNNDYAICDLCYAVGYSDEVHFIRAFKKKYGVPPKQFRKLAVAKRI